MMFSYIDCIMSVINMYLSLEIKIQTFKYPVRLCHNHTCLKYRKSSTSLFFFFFLFCFLFFDKQKLRSGLKNGVDQVTGTAQVLPKATKCFAQMKQIDVNFFETSDKVCMSINAKCFEKENKVRFVENYFIFVCFQNA